MEFVFEGRRTPGGRTPGGTSPDYPAVRITRHKEGAKDNRYRLYFAFNPEAVELARWIDGDMITPGADRQNRMIGFKRDPLTGFRLSTLKKGQRRHNANFQASYETASAIRAVIENSLGKWIRLHQAGILLVTETIE